MHAMTQDNLRSAFGGESQAHVRYGIWAKAAGKEGFPNVERLFNCTAEAERVHGNLHFKALKDIHGDFAVTSMAGFGIGSTSENLQKGIDGETFEFTEMYPAFIEVAKMQGEDEAVKAMRYAIEAEKSTPFATKKRKSSRRRQGFRRKRHSSLPRMRLHHLRCK